MSDVTHILDAVGQGDLKAADELLPLVYDELRQLAAGKLAQEKLGQTLQPTALVHEAWLGLFSVPRIRVLKGVGIFCRRRRGDATDSH